LYRAIKAEAFGGVAIGQAFEALEDHDGGHDHGRHAPAAKIGEQIGEELVRKEPRALSMEQGIDRVRLHPAFAELARASEEIGLHRSLSEGHRGLASCTRSGAPSSVLPDES
jgi:hypothetical protein